MNEWMRLVFSLTLSGSAVAVVAVLVRCVCVRWVPKWFLSCLWLSVLLSFLLPLGSKYSLISTPQVTQKPMSQVQDIFLWSENETILPMERHDRNSVAQTVSHPVGLSDFLPHLWLCGALTVLAWKLVGYRRFRRRVLNAARSPEEWERRLLCHMAGSSKAPKLLRSPGTEGPMLLGVWKCALILPETSYPSEILEDVFAHELAHWTRHDLALKWLAVLIVCLHWFNPVCWWLAEQIDRDCELACDEQVLKCRDLEHRRRYGRTLVLVAARHGASQGLTAPMYSQKQRLKERLEQIMQPQKAGWCITAVLCIAALTMVLSTTLLGVYAGSVAPENKQAAPISSELESTEFPVVQSLPEQLSQMDSPATAEAQFLLPLKTDTPDISTLFESHVNPDGEVIRHDGVDFRAENGTEVMAVDDGVVITSTFISSHGQYVVISHGDDVSTLYANMLYESQTVFEGDVVTRGQVIGQVGATGMATGPHLHFEVWQDGMAVNPLDHLPIG